MSESILIPIDLTNGNAGRGGAFWESAKRRQSYEAILRYEGFIRQPLDVQIDLTLTRILGPGQRFWDADSVLRGGAKELIDAMVACGWFHDDGPKWIRRAIGLQDNARRQDGPAVLVTIDEVNE